MNKNNSYSKSNEELILEKGIHENNMFLYFRDKYFFITENHIRSFKFSLKRAKNSLSITNNDIIFKIFVKYIGSIKLQKVNENLFYLNITYPNVGIKNMMIPQQIKIKEVSDYLVILNNDSLEIIIKKQNDKITSLLAKIDEFEKRFNDPNTDDDFILPIQ